MRTRIRRRSFARRRSRRTHWSLALVFALVFAPAGARPTRAACIEFAQPPAISTVSQHPIAALPVDLDRDGDLDLLGAFFESNEISWFENDGAGGGWAKRTITTTANSVLVLQAGDLDGDGDLDVVSKPEFSGVAWYENDGAGSGWTVHFIQINVEAAELLDADGDGDLDVVVHGLNVTRWLENDGEGAGWTVHTVRTGVFGSVGLAGADVDHDGDVDLVAANGYTDEVAWYRNNGAGGGWNVTTISTASSSASAVAVADVDGDGNLDVFSTTGASDDIVWHENSHSSGNGSTWTAHPVSTHPIGSSRLHSADFDGDGDIDLLSAGSYGIGLRWHENAGAGATWKVHTIAPAVFAVTRLSAADLDDDGDVDALSASFADDTIAWYRNDRLHGRALHAGRPPIWTSANSLSRSVVAGDLHGDGIPDAVSCRPTENLLTWFFNNGTGDAWIAIDVSTAFAIYEVIVADLDGDGDLDVVGATRNAGIYWFKNNGGGGGWTVVTISTTAGASSLVAADLDRDGDLDLLASIESLLLQPSLAWFENDGVGSGWSQHSIFSGSFSFEAATADFDGDGDLDVLSSGASQNALVWLENVANGSTWVARSVATTSDSTYAVAAADVDGDGDLDGIATSASAYSGLDLVAWYENDGTPAAGSWNAHVVSTALGKPGSVQAADLDGDGDLDLLVTDWASDTVAWFENDDLGESWTMRALTSATDSAEDVIAADLDRDGDLDVLAAARGASGLVWFENLGSKVFDDGFDSDANTSCWSSAQP